MSHWRHTLVDGAKFWINYKQLKLRKVGCLQLIESSTPSTIVWRQCVAWMGKILVVWFNHAFRLRIVIISFIFQYQILLICSKSFAWVKFLSLIYLEEWMNVRLRRGLTHKWVRPTWIRLTSCIVEVKSRRWPHWVLETVAVWMFHSSVDCKRIIFKLEFDIGSEVLFRSNTSEVYAEKGSHLPFQLYAFNSKESICFCFDKVGFIQYYTKTQ